MTSASPTRRRHRILMFTGYYLPYISGMTIYAQRLAEGLVRRGHQVTILCSHHDARLPLREDLGGVQVVRSRARIAGRIHLYPDRTCDAQAGDLHPPL